ncbi:MAG: hypothetical protein JXA10_14155, partial [Anaerolineae bacterium]|nr:hypothetical protein [Anaerolineae bacterium]
FKNLLFSLPLPAGEGLGMGVKRLFKRSLSYNKTAALSEGRHFLPMHKLVNTRMDWLHHQ